MKSELASKKLIYVMGCGRSGTTILGIVLGNGEGCLDLGEVIDFLKRKGVPNDFGPETTTGQFWNSVTNSVLEKNHDLFSEKMIADLMKLENHKTFPLTFFGLCNSKSVNNYSNYINSLYSSIATHSKNANAYIESSKYPGRALLLFLLLKNIDIHVLHLVRHPIDVVESLGDKKKANIQGHKGFVSANLYYFVINLYCLAVKLKVGTEKYIKIRYEDLLAKPKDTIDVLARKFDIDFHKVTATIDNDRPLKRGHIFNGNRMRMNNELVLEKSQKSNGKRTFKNAVIMMINGLWY